MRPNLNLNARNAREIGMEALLPLLLLVGLIVWVVRKMQKRMKPVYCVACGTEAPAKVETRGSLLIEIVLWMCFIIPGVIYSLWRTGARQNVCSSCGSTQVIPPDSPNARRLKAQ